MTPDLAPSNDASSLLITAFVAVALVLVVAAVLALRLPKRKLAAVAPSDGAIRIASTNGRPRLTEVEKQLAEAGFTHPWAVQFFYLGKVMAAVAGFVVGVVISALPQLADAGAVNRLVLIATMTLLGLFAPTTFVDRRRKAWRSRIEAGVPDALDFMLVCVEAGQSIDMAAARVANELGPVHPDLALRFTDLTKELAAGASREEAFMHLAQVTGSHDLRQYATLVIQSSTMGTPMAHSLRVFTADLRDRRIRAVEERANVLPTKMTLGTMMFTVPPLLILLLTPAVYRLIIML